MDERVEGQTCPLTEVRNKICFTERTGFPRVSCFDDVAKDFVCVKGVLISIKSKVFSSISVIN